MNVGLSQAFATSGLIFHFEVPPPSPASSVLRLRQVRDVIDGQGRFLDRMFASKAVGSLSRRLEHYPDDPTCVVFECLVRLLQRPKDLMGLCVFLGRNSFFPDDEARFSLDVVEGRGLPHKKSKKNEPCYTPIIHPPLPLKATTRTGCLTDLSLASFITGKTNLLNKVYRAIPYPLNFKQVLEILLLGDLSLQAFDNNYGRSIRRVRDAESQLIAQINHGALPSLVACDTQWQGMNLLVHGEASAFVHTTSSYDFALNWGGILPPKGSIFPKRKPATVIIIETLRGLDLNKYALTFPPSQREGIGCKKEYEVIIPVAINPREIIHIVHRSTDGEVLVLTPRPISAFETSVEIRRPSGAVEIMRFRIAEDFSSYAKI